MGDSVPEETEKQVTCPGCFREIAVSHSQQNPEGDVLVVQCECGKPFVIAWPSGEIVPDEAQ